MQDLLGFQLLVHGPLLVFLEVSNVLKGKLSIYMLPT